MTELASRDKRLQSRLARLCGFSSSSQIQISDVIDINHKTFDPRQATAELQQRVTDLLTRQAASRIRGEESVGTFVRVNGVGTDGRDAFWLDQGPRTEVEVCTTDLGGDRTCEDERTHNAGMIWKAPGLE